MFTYVYHELARKLLRICIFMFSFFYLVLIMTKSFCSYPILRFNRADLIYLRPLPVGGFCTVIRLRYRAVSLLFLRIDICMNICIAEIDSVVV